MNETPQDAAPGGRSARLRRRLRRWADVVPPTPRGLVVAALALVALVPFGFEDLDLVLFVMGLVGLLLTALAWLLVGVARWWLGRRIRPRAGGGLDLVTGSRIATGFAAPSLDAWPLLRFGWMWLRPAEVRVRARLRGTTGLEEAVEEVVAARRTVEPTIRRRFQVEDVFGLARLAWEVETETRVVVSPDVGRLASMPVVQSLARCDGLPHPAGAPEGDRMEIRRYVPGDSVRHILWKTFARTRELNVRLPERSVDRSRRTVAYLLAGPDDEASAAAARVALEGGALGDDWLFGADGAEEPTSDLEAARLAIATSGRRPPAAAPSAAGLTRFLDRVARTGEAHCVVFAPVVEGAWIGEALRARAAFGGRLSVVFGTDGVARPEGSPLWHRLLWTPVDASGTPADRLARVVRTVAAGGAPTLVVDRRSGRAYGDVEQRALAGVA